MPNNKLPRQQASNKQQDNKPAKGNKPATNNRVTNKATSQQQTIG
jgi:hypothetical protein